MRLDGGAGHASTPWRSTASRHWSESTGNGPAMCAKAHALAPYRDKSGAPGAVDTIWNPASGPLSEFTLLSFR
jgi:hypothetical protein